MLLRRQGILVHATLSCILHSAVGDSAESVRHASAILDPTYSSGFRIIFTSEFGGSSLGPSAAWAEYKEDMNQSGWSWLELHTNASFTDAQQATAAGLVEGALTRERIDEFLYNTGNAQDFDDDLKDYIRRNTDWMKDQIRRSNDDPFWYHVGLAYQQLQGVWAGYNAMLEKAGRDAVDWATFYAPTLAGDLDDLCEVFTCTGRLGHKVHNTSNSHCSALIRMVEGELFVGHSTWSQFETMTRIYKLYNLAYKQNSLPGHAVAFPSYPGIIISIDDFYQTSAGLVVMETTNANANTDLWKMVVPQTLLYWVRSFVANLQSNSGPEWAETFSRYNSGTYNNQWMVVDTKLYNPQPGARGAHSLQPHTLTVSELLPGHVHTEDMTSSLATNGYWISYNRPYFQDIFDISGQPALVKKYGDHYNWTLNARGQIFRRFMPDVIDHDSYRRIMRYNDFENDPVGKQGCKHGPSASNAIAERGDLTPADADCIPDIQRQDEGQIDVKYTTASLMRAGSLSAITQSGPTYDTQPAFKWSTSSLLSQTSHRGQPDLWKFPWVNSSWRYRMLPALTGLAVEREAHNELLIIV